MIKRKKQIRWPNRDRQGSDQRSGDRRARRKSAATSRKLNGKNGRLVLIFRMELIEWRPQKETSLFPLDFNQCLVPHTVNTLRQFNNLF